MAHNKYREHLALLLFVLLITALNVLPSCVSSPSVTSSPEINTHVQTTTLVSSDLKFIPDSGVRMDNASNPAARVNKDGSISLLYQDLTEHRTKLTRSPEGIEFTPGTEINPHHFRAIALPDGTHRSYLWEPRVVGLVSETSRDGVVFSTDTGVRYALQPDDKGMMGVHELFVDRSGGVVLLYIGDLFGLNNIRRAYSRDNGWTFTFDRGNVLGDAGLGGGGRSFVDQKAIVLPDGRIRLFTMKGGTLFGFISTDDGRTFTQENFQLRPQDFREQGLISLHDPQPVRLLDGRYRIYVTGIVDDGHPVAQSSPSAKQVIVSATTEK